MPEDRRLTTILLVAVCLLYIAARLWRLSDSCLWFDEVFSVHAVEHDWYSLLRFAAQDLIHPPLFYLLLKLWISVGGESVFWLRLLPVAFSVLALFPFVRLCRELKFGTPVLLLSLFLMAVNGALIKYTQTLRMYSMLMFFALMSMWLFARYFNRGKSFAPLVITNVLLIYTHYFGWLVIGAEIATLLIFQRIKWRRILVMAGVLSAAFVPWLLAVWQAARQGSDLAQNIAWQVRPGIKEIVTFATDVVEPFYFQASSAEPVSIYPISLPLVGIVLVGLILYLSDWKNEDRRQPVYVLLIFSGLPLVLSLIFSWILPHSIWGTRHMIITLPPLLILIAHTIFSVRVRPIRLALLAVVLLVACVAFVLEARREIRPYVWCSWNDVAANIRQRQPSTIYAFENLVAYHLWFALRDSEEHRVGVVKGLDVRTADETYFLPRGFDGVSRSELSGVTNDSIWIAFRTSRPGEDAPLVANFTNLGYYVCNSYRSSIDATTVHWVELRRDQASCR